MTSRALQRACLTLLVLLLSTLVLQAQDLRPDTLTDLAWSTEATTQRFVAVHGRRAVIMGYPEHGLEVWAYPLQLISDYQVSFENDGDTGLLAGNTLLRKVEYRPDTVIRTYVGPDFAVRETLFVPLDSRGAILGYEVEGNRNVRLRVQFLPSLNLMWPGALGGQDVRWDATLSGYVITEPLHRNIATISSPDIVDHEAVINRTISPSDLETLVLRPQIDSTGHRVASLIVAADEPGTTPGTAAGDLQRDEVALRAQAVTHYRTLVNSALSIETPDPQVNRALAWSTIALDQAWACDPTIGCGELAGFGPSRRGRRPQYAWFFAGDGLVATNAWVESGAFDRARQELDFILKYQNQDNGMIWHEISPGVPIEEWKRDYPYMYVHVDITYEFLTALARYVAASRDVAFLRTHRDSIAAAFRYCQSLIDPATALPRIPPGRESANEQDRMRDDISLSSAWISAAQAMAAMLQILGDRKQAEQALAAAESAKRSIASRDWDPGTHFWLAGHTASGEPMHTFRPGPVEILNQGIFTSEQSREILDRLTSPDFQTDWGVRNLSASSPGYDPRAYGGGSVSALGTTALAGGLWNLHWNLPALQLWEEILPWNTLDSQGHIHELLAGDLYHPEIESVPEQTWSSAGLLNATVHGLLGLSINGLEHSLGFAPHLVPQWGHIAVRHIHVNQANVDLQLTYAGNQITLEANNLGEPTTLDFQPELPLGAASVTATIAYEGSGEHRTLVNLQSTPTDSHASLQLALPAGRTRCRIQYRGGVEVLVPAPAPTIGSPSSDLHLGAVQWQGGALDIDAYVASREESTLTLQTDWHPLTSQGAEIKMTAPRTYTLQLDADPAKTTSQRTVSGYTHRTLTVRFKERP